MSNPQKTREQAIEWLHNNAGNHVGKNIRRYRYTAYVAQPAFNTLGLKKDLKPLTGKVVELTDDWALVKEGANKFMVVDTDLMATLPPKGAKVTITPYSRRRFDGKRMDEPFESKGTDGVAFLTHIIGGAVQLPLDKESPDKVYTEGSKGDISGDALLSLIEYVETLQTPDGMRTIAGCLVDAGCRVDGFSYQDPSENDDWSVTPPMLQFAIKNTRHTGTLQIIYDGGKDTYTVKLLDSEFNTLTAIDYVLFAELGQAVFELIDDGKWVLAQVEIHSKPRARKVA